MSNHITEDDLDLLDELGVDAQATTTGGRSAREQRIIAGFEEIQRFHAEHGRLPEHGESRDIFERLYAVRLGQLRASAECREVLKEIDAHGLLGEVSPVTETSGDSEPSDEELLAALGVEVPASHDVTELVHVRSHDEIKAAEEIAQRNPCKDFEDFKPLFEKVQSDLAAGLRQTLKYKDNAAVNKGNIFILDGQKIIVADMGESFVSEHGRPDCRLKVVYDNGTESDLLVRSLQRALNKDKASRRITDPDFGPLFSDHEDEDDLPSGQIYVLRSMSDNSFVAANRTVIHKIGVTGGEVKSRIANAKRDPTYLLAEVEVVAAFKLLNINRKRLEALLHKFFGRARLDLELKDRFGSQVEPKEWFLAPLPVIEEFIEKLKTGTLAMFRYDIESAKIVPATNQGE